MAADPPRETGTGRRKRRKLLNEETFSDITIKFGDHEVLAHKAILANASHWFDIALTSGFSEATSPVVDIGDEEDSDAIYAMLKHFYGTRYAEQDPTGKDKLSFHLAVYMLGDMYDCDTLRKDAEEKFFSSADVRIFHQQQPRYIHDRDIYTLQQVLGPDAAQVADASFQRRLLNQVIRKADMLCQKKAFMNLLVKGEMLDKDAGESFAIQIIALAKFKEDKVAQEDQKIEEAMEAEKAQEAWEAREFRKLRSGKAAHA